jgi:xylono-1,5-lactonase
VCHVRDGRSRVLLTVEGAVGFNDLTTDAQGRVYVGSMRSAAMQIEDRVPSELWRIDGRGARRRGLRRRRVPERRRLRTRRPYDLPRELQRGLVAGARPRRRRYRGQPAHLRSRAAREPDGLAVDEAGGVWVALGEGGAVARFASDGTLDRTVPVPSSFVTSLCFGGSDRRDPYVVTTNNTDDPGRGATVFRVRSDIPGLPVPHARV